MKTLLIAILLACALTLPAIAQSVPMPDVLGVYFDEQATSWYVTAPPFVPFNAYVVLSNASVPAIVGWEAGIDITGPAYILPPTFPSGGFNSLAAPLYRVTYATPLPCGATTTLLTIPMFVASAAPQCIGMFGLGGQSGPGSGPILFPDGGGHLEASVNLLWQGGGNSVAEVNGGSPVIGGRPWCADVVATEQVSWGAMKGMYR